MIRRGSKVRIKWSRDPSIIGDTAVVSDIPHIDHSDDELSCHILLTSGRWDGETFYWSCKHLELLTKDKVVLDLLEVLND